MEKEKAHQPAARDCERCHKPHFSAERIPDESGHPAVMWRMPRLIRAQRLAKRISVSKRLSWIAGTVMIRMLRKIRSSSRPITILLSRGGPARTAISLRSKLEEHEDPKFRNKKMLNPKLETLNSKQTQMSKTQNSKPYDLRDRTFRFARMVRNYVRNLPKTLSNIEDARQLIKSSGSVGANYTCPVK